MPCQAKQLLPSITQPVGKGSNTLRVDTSRPVSENASYNPLGLPDVCVSEMPVKIILVAMTDKPKTVDMFSDLIVVMVQGVYVCVQCIYQNVCIKSVSFFVSIILQ